MIVTVVPPPGIEPRPSSATQTPPIDRPLSVPTNFSGGLSGAMDASISDVHSPTSRSSHWCSVCGSACIGVSRWSLRFAGRFQNRHDLLHLDRVVEHAARRPQALLPPHAHVVRVVDLFAHLVH